MLAARAVGALAVLEVNAPVIDYPGSAKVWLDPSVGRGADAPVARVAVRRRRSDRDAGRRPGLTTEERDRLKTLEWENRELKRANEILRKASAFFAQAELDRRPR